MAKYVGCFVGNDGLLHLGTRVKNITNIRILDRILANFYPEESPSIVWTKKEIETTTRRKHKKGKFYVKTAEGIKVPVDII